MLKTKKEVSLYKVLSCIFAVIFVVYVIIYRKIIDVIYLTILSVFILEYFIEIRRK